MDKPVRFSLLADVPEGTTIAEYATALERHANTLSGMSGVTVSWTRPHEPGTEPGLADLSEPALAGQTDDEFRETLRTVVMEAARRRFDPDAVRFHMTREPVDLAGERQYREEMACGRDPRD